MSNEEDFILRQERRLLDDENEARLRQGQDLKPIPESLRTEEEQLKAIERGIAERKEIAKHGFNRDTPIRFVDSDDDEDEEDEEV
jgi:hypothetical protein